jgi:hypothetical protein
MRLNPRSSSSEPTHVGSTDSDSTDSGSTNLRGATTICVDDYRTEPQTRVSWNDVQIHREEIRLPRRRPLSSGR